MNPEVFRGQKVVVKLYSFKGGANIVKEARAYLLGIVDFMLEGEYQE